MVMKLTRRIFFAALLFVPAKQTKSLEAAVLETFDMDGRTVAILVNHGRPSIREEFAMWLRSRPRAIVRVRTPSGVETTAFMFRVRMCFGRALMILREPTQIREGDRVFVEWKQNGD
jgi:hypothetical protein